MQDTNTNLAEILEENTTRITDIRSGIPEETGIVINPENYEEVLTRLKSYEEKLRVNPEANLQNAISSPSELSLDQRKKTHYLFEVAKGISMKNPNKPNGERPTQKRGLSIALVDTELAKHNFFELPTKYNGQFKKNPINIYNPKFREVIDYSVSSDGMIVADIKSGELLMPKAIFKGFSENLLPENMKNKFYEEKINTRTLNTILASYFGASILVKNSTGEVAAYHAGELIHRNEMNTPDKKSKANQKRYNIPLYCNVNQVAPTLTQL